MWNFLEKRPFFQADMAGLGSTVVIHHFHSVTSLKLLRAVNTQYIFHQNTIAFEYNFYVEQIITGMLDMA